MDLIIANSLFLKFIFVLMVFIIFVMLTKEITVTNPKQIFALP